MTGFKFFPLILFLLISSFVSAQQLPLFTQYRENATILNPAAMESDFLSQGYNLTFGAAIRNQWSDYAGGPRTKTLRASYINTEHSGAALLAGGHIISDITGPTGLFALYGRIGAVISPDPEYSGISLAISGGVGQYKIDAEKIRLLDIGDPVGTQTRTQLYPDVGFGIYAYQTVGDGNMLYGGVSVPQVLGLDLSFTDENGQFAISRVRHYYGQLGFYKFFADGDGFLEPSAWVKYTPGAPINVDLNLRVQLPGSIWIGTGISSAMNFHMETGFNLGDNVGFDNLLKIGYGFDYSFSQFGPFTGSTHEIIVTTSFGGYSYY